MTLTGAPSSLSTSSLEASPVSRSALPGSDRDRTTTDGSGLSSPVPLAHYDPDTSSWRTSQGSLFEGWETYSETWPRSGMTLSGTLYLLPPLVPRISATESGSSVGPNSQGLWPTPVAAGDHATMYAQGGMSLGYAARLWPTPNAWDPSGTRTLPEGTTPQGMTPEGRKKQVGLANAVEAVESGRWPTPTRSDAVGGPGTSGRLGGENLRTAVARFPTPAVAMHKGSSLNAMTRKTGASRHNDRLDYSVEEGRIAHGRLNPTWVEWLMGFPLGWTDLEPSAMPSSRKSSSSSAGASSKRKRSG